MHEQALGLDETRYATMWRHYYIDQRVRAFAYGAALHCVDCAVRYWNNYATLDGAQEMPNGETVGVLFTWSEGWAGEYCDTCHQRLDS